VADPVSTGGAVIVATADRKARALSARDLSASGSWSLTAPLAGPPSAIENGCVVADRSGDVMAFSRDGERVWSISLGAAAVGRPLLEQQALWFVTADGFLHVRARSDGASRQRVALGALPSSGLFRLGDLLLVGAGRGSVRPLAAELTKGIQSR
jgi:outer membrane protein assembly factor BamB